METCEKLLTQCLNCSFQLKCATAAAAAKSLQSCPTLCDSIEVSPPGSPIPEILQARTLEWVAISFSNAWRKVHCEVAQSCPTLCDPMDCSLPGSSVHGIFQARVLEWGAITFSGIRTYSVPNIMLDFYYHGKNWSVSVSSFLFNPSFILWLEQLF